MLSGCSDVEDHLAAGRVREACLRAKTHHKERPALEAWLQQHTRLAVSEVPADEVAAALGGSVRGYGSGLRVADISARVTLADDGARGVKGANADAVPHAIAAIDLPRHTLGMEDLVMNMPPLVQLARAPHPARVNEAELRPSVRRSGYRGRDPITGIIDAVGAVGMGIGAAVGAAVAVPIGVVAGIAHGIGSVFGALFGNGTRSSSHAVSPIDRIAPVRRESPVDQRATDALLRSPVEYREAVAALEALHTEHVAAIDAERQRRMALLTTPEVLQLNPDDCPTGHCRVVVDALPPTIDLNLRFFDDAIPAEYQEQIREVRTGDGCEYPITLTVPTISTDTDPDLVTNTQTVEVAAADTLLALALTRSLDEAAPAWALDAPGALPVAWKKRLKPGSLADDGIIKDLRCTVTVHQRRFDSDGSPPDLVVQVTAGKVTSRVHTVYLGRNVSSATFMTRDINLLPGERLRLGLVSRGGRSLGGDIVDHLGDATLKLGNPAFSARCEAVNMGDDAAVDVVKAATGDAQRALTVFIAAAEKAKAHVAEEPSPPEAAGKRSKRPRRHPMAAVAAERTKVQEALVKLSAVVGWSAPELQTLVGELTAADPLTAPR